MALVLPAGLLPLDGVADDVLDLLVLVFGALDLGVVVAVAVVADANGASDLVFDVLDASASLADDQA
jgi:hypothetical protein